jgi:protein gp37
VTGKTTIEWATAVWNPTTGCTRVSAGCDNCYAFALHDKRYASNLHAANDFLGVLEVDQRVESRAMAARRMGVKMPWPKQYDRPFSRVQLLPERLDDPLRHKKPERYFVDSMSDLFHEDVPDEYLDRVFLRMALNRRHRFLILTKRPERMSAYCHRVMPSPSPEDLDHVSTLTTPGEREVVGDWARLSMMGLPQPPPNVWLGTSVEDQASADERIPHLLATPAAVRFLSCEPLLGPIDLVSLFQDGTAMRELEKGVAHYNVRIDWVIVGGESGPRARPMDLAWARSLVEQCRAAGVTPFVKQLGSRPYLKVTVAGSEALRDETYTPEYPWGSMPLHLRESHGRDMAEWPEDLRVREFPR